MVLAEVGVNKNALLLAAVMPLAIPAAAEGPVAVGDSKAVVITTLGRPSGQALRGGTELLFYEAGVVEVTKGKVSAIDPEFEAKWAEQEAQEAFEDRQTAKGLVKWQNGWVTPAEKEKLEAASRKAQAKAPTPTPSGAARIEVIRRGGAAMALDEILVQGSVTIVDFFADWCGPCRAMGPQLERFAAENPDVCLRQVDIVNWSSEVARQYQLRSIPNLRVFDAHGRQVGEPTHSFQEVVRQVARARGGS